MYYLWAMETDRYKDINSRNLREELWPKYKLEDRPDIIRLTTWFRFQNRAGVYLVGEYIRYRAKDLHLEGGALKYVLKRTGEDYSKYSEEAVRSFSDMGRLDKYQGEL